MRQSVLEQEYTDPFRARTQAYLREQTQEEETTRLAGGPEAREAAAAAARARIGRRGPLLPWVPWEQREAMQAALERDLAEARATQMQELMSGEGAEAQESIRRNQVWAAAAAEVRRLMERPAQVLSAAEAQAIVNALPSQALQAAREQQQQQQGGDEMLRNPSPEVQAAEQAQLTELQSRPVTLSLQEAHAVVEETPAEELLLRHPQEAQAAISEDEAQQLVDAIPNEAVQGAQRALLAFEQYWLQQQAEVEAAQVAARRAEAQQESTLAPLREALAAAREAQVAALREDNFNLTAAEAERIVDANPSSEVWAAQRALAARRQEVLLRPQLGPEGTERASQEFAEQEHRAKEAANLVQAAFYDLGATQAGGRNRVLHGMLTEHQGDWVANMIQQFPGLAGREIVLLKTLTAEVQDALLQQQSESNRAYFSAIVELVTNALENKPPTTFHPGAFVRVARAMGGMFVAYRPRVSKQELQALVEESLQSHNANRVDAALRLADPPRDIHSRMGYYAGDWLRGVQLVRADQEKAFMYLWRAVSWWRTASEELSMLQRAHTRGIVAQLPQEAQAGLEENAEETREEMEGTLQDMAAHPMVQECMRVNSWSFERWLQQLRAWDKIDKQREVRAVPWGSLGRQLGMQANAPQGKALRVVQQLGFGGGQV